MTDHNSDLLTYYKQQIIESELGGKSPSRLAEFDASMARYDLSMIATAKRHQLRRHQHYLAALEEICSELTPNYPSPVLHKTALVPEGT